MPRAGPCTRAAANHCVRSRTQATASASAREISFADLSKLPYINACIQESMRLEPTVGVGTWRDADSDMTIGGHFIAKGTSIGLPFLATFTSPANFPDAMQYKPERWLGSGGGGAAAAPLTVTAAHSSVAGAGARCPMAVGAAGGARPLPQQMYPFSVGDRNCIGRSLAQMEMPLVIAKLFAHYDVAYADDVAPLESLYAHEVYAATSGPPFLHLRLSAWS